MKTRYGNRKKENQRDPGKNTNITQTKKQSIKKLKQNRTKSVSFEGHDFNTGSAEVAAKLRKNDEENKNNGEELKEREQQPDTNSIESKWSNISRSTIFPMGSPVPLKPEWLTKKEKEERRLSEISEKREILELSKSFDEYESFELSVQPLTKAAGENKKK